MAEVLDDGLELIVSEKIDGVSSGVKSFLEVWLEWVHNKATFEIGIRCEYLSWVDSSEFEWPVVDDDDLVVEVDDVDVGELGVELIDGFLGEVAGDEEESIGHEEMGVGFLHVALKRLLQVLWNLWKVSSLVEHLCEQLLESRLLSLTLAHWTIDGCRENCLFKVLKEINFSAI